MIKIGFFQLESRVCILCWKFVWGHLHKTEVRQRKERSSSCDDECLVLKKKAVSQLVLLIRETDYTIFIVWAVPQTILQKPVCYFTTGWVSACCTFAMLLSDVWQLKEVISQHCEHHCRFKFFFQFDLQLEVCFARVDWDHWKRIDSLYIDMGFKLHCINIR